MLILKLYVMLIFPSFWRNYKGDKIKNFQKLSIVLLIIFLSGNCVQTNISNHFWIGFAGSIKTFRKFKINTQILIIMVLPNDVSTYSFFKSPSIVFGHPTTLVWHFSLVKYSANKQALVFESSPPITIKPSNFKASQCILDFSNCSGVSILSLPEPIIYFYKKKIFRFSYKSYQSLLCSCSNWWGLLRFQRISHCKCWPDHLRTQIIVNLGVFF